MKITLIQLVSEQTMQNLLPILAFRPAKVVHLVTPKVAGRAAHIEEAARQAGILPAFETVKLSEMPQNAEVCGEVGKAILTGQTGKMVPVVNFTGGTKLMSIGAFHAALIGKSTSVYVDTEHGHFMDGGTGPLLTGLLGADLGFGAFEKLLRVDIIAAANGCGRVTQGLDFERFAALADHLLSSPEDEAACWEAVYGENGLASGGRQPRQPAQWLELCKKDFSLPAEVARLAAEIGVVEMDQSGAYRLACANAKVLERFAAMGGRFKPAPPYFQAIEPLQKALAFLGGGWWEVAIALAAKRSGQFRDVRWSVEAGRRGFGGSIEEDVVAVEGVRIAYFSCKRGGDRGKLLRHLEELDSSAKHLGGTFARKFLCVFKPLAQANKTEVERRAGELNIKIITPGKLGEPGCFTE